MSSKTCKSARGEPRLDAVQSAGAILWVEMLSSPDYFERRFWGSSINTVVQRWYGEETLFSLGFLSDF